MAKFVINGVELEFDLLEADNADVFEKATNDIIVAQKNAEGVRSLGDGIRVVCEAVNVFIDMLFGDGTSYEIFGDSVNLRETTQIYKQINDEIAKDGDEYKAFVNDISPNRAVRRSISK